MRDRPGVETDRCRRDRCQQREQATSSHGHGHRDLLTVRDVARLPALWMDGHVHVAATKSVYDPARSRFTAWSDVADDRERGLGDLRPDLSGGHRTPARL